MRGGNVVKLAYGPAGRMKTTVSGTNPRTIWNFGGLIERRTRTDGVVQIERQVPGPLGTFVSLRTTLTAAGAPGATETIYRHGDGRANRFFTQADGTVIQATTYAAFGNLTSDSGAAGLTYTDDLWNGGDNLPEVGVVLLGPRAYDPAIGRFLQRDPIAILARSTTANPYAFSFNDPVNHADPTGLSGECADGSCAGAIVSFNAGAAGLGCSIRCCTAAAAAAEAACRRARRTARASCMWQGVNLQRASRWAPPSDWGGGASVRPAIASWRRRGRPPILTALIRPSGSAESRSRTTSTATSVAARTLGVSCRDLRMASERSGRRSTCFHAAAHNSNSTRSARDRPRGRGAPEACGPVPQVETSPSPTDSHGCACWSRTRPSSWRRRSITQAVRLQTSLSKAQLVH
ncbi:MAG: RHS repeat-associated core domain-containing protein [Myxococcales bacterium]|nr:RHS repeat-associated core domain-containing protein [Myxococcales bacterium]